jgi:hypothetical protein
MSISFRELREFAGDHDVHLYVDEGLRQCSHLFRDFALSLRLTYGNSRERSSSSIAALAQLR